MSETDGNRSLHADAVGGSGGLGVAADASTDEVRSLYDGWVDEYDADVISWGYDAPSKVAGLLGEHVALTATVLDAGCGTGLTGAALRATGFETVTGVDASPESVRQATTRRVYHQCDVADLSQPLPFADSAFGGVICCGVLSYLPDVHAVLSEFVRVTASGGAVVFTQRTDLWESRSTQQAVDRLVADQRCTADVSGASPYLPGHPDFGDSIGIRYVTLQVT